MRTLAVVACAWLLGGCALFGGSPHHLATAQVAEDFPTYEIRRVGLVPFHGSDVGADLARSLQDSFLAEVGRATDYEVVRLGPTDLAEIPGSEPYRRGWYRPNTILAIGRRFKVDAMLVGTVTQLNPYPPQSLGLNVDLVSAETGLVIWHGSVHLDAADERVRRSLEEYFESKNAEVGSKESIGLTMLSPRRFARFAAYQVAQLL